ncbi:hypothetical protein [Actinokineospora globicatena]|uniref:hypothetical protein n=1 Tax=Actinokineospora globicatena TaxID=103729 RepID=UPI0020A289A9|nr:hypothetical protein [Actinokineospora globicatena]MCP2305244.1 hypothetical protein [Actinokineospora globicatena]GLW80720.1 hypothetical protein Aglo01_52010 [Actinokineospora globicatena]GLW87547.1 hypothetical protein Aglo02_51860 [Actinokineospora globicatena]
MFKSTVVALVTVLGTAVPASASPTDLSYAYRYPLALETDLSVEALTAAVTADFRRYFPYDSNCPSLPPVSGRCDLYSLAGRTNPVVVIDRTANSWTFLSLPGHSEGEGRNIVFSFERGNTGVELRARAGGPFTVTAAAKIYSGAAYAIWSLFANNVSDAY